jgi:hypothetical protein
MIYSRSVVEPKDIPGASIAGKVAIANSTGIECWFEKHAIVRCICVLIKGGLVDPISYISRSINAVDLRDNRGRGRR